MSIVARSLTKRFGAFTALDDVTVEIPTGELVALLGPSGSGKTTLLRLIAGLEAPDAGSVLFDGEDATRRDVRDRRVGFVFQHYALFRHMSVFDNVAFGLRVKPRRSRPDPAALRARVHALLALVQMDGLADRSPAQLSGGQRQRVALARALAIEPRVLLLDEPFGALDAQVRKELRRWLRRLHDEVGVTSAFVTHDVDEALEVADRVVVMAHGRVEQVGTPADVYRAPATPFVYRFLGGVNVFRARDFGHATAAAGVGYARPHDVTIERSLNGHGGVPALVRHVMPVGGVVRVQLDRADGAGALEAELTAESHAGLALRAGERVFVWPRVVRVFAGDGTAVA